MTVGQCVRRMLAAPGRSQLIHFGGDVDISLIFSDAAVAP